MLIKLSRFELWVTTAQRASKYLTSKPKLNK